MNKNELTDFSDLPHPTEYFDQQKGEAWGPAGIATLYYPGAYTDFGPIDLFSPQIYYENPPAEFVTAIYVDYDINLQSVEKFAESLKRRYGANRLIETVLSPQDFGMKCIEDFYPFDEQFLNHKLNINQDFFAVRYFFKGINLNLIYIKADAIQTFKILSKNNIHPNIVVVQDHGCGGGWTSFGGNSLLHRCAKVKPKYLYVAKDDPWPGYKPISKPIIDEGQMHNFTRQLYINCTSSDLI